MTEQIIELRKIILDIDAQIVRLLCRRMKMVQRIAKIKKSEGKSVVDTSREQQVFDYVTSLPHDPIQTGHLLELYEHIVRISRETQSDFLKEIPE